MITPEFLSNEWREEANCATTDPDLFHPAKGDSAKPALKICAVCTVTAECLADALLDGKQRGIRGGMTPSARTRLRVDGKDAA